MTEQKEIMKLYNELINSELFTFPNTGKMKVSDRHGVYIIYSSDEEVLHVGNTPRGKKGLNQRLYNHCSGASSFCRNYLKPKNISVRNGYKFKFLEVDIPRTRVLLEALTQGLLCPAHIGTGEK